MAGDLIVEGGAPRLSSQDRLLALVQSRHPDYHPVLAMVEIAMEQRKSDDGDPNLEFACHKEVAKYVVQVDRHVEVKAEVTKTKRVLVELFGGPDHPAKAADVTDVEAKPQASVAEIASAQGVSEAAVVASALMAPGSSLLDVWGDGATASAASRFVG